MVALGNWGLALGPKSGYNIGARMPSLSGKPEATRHSHFQAVGRDAGVKRYKYWLEFHQSLLCPSRGLVGKTGLEPARVCNHPRLPKSRASANFATSPAMLWGLLP